MSHLVASAEAAPQPSISPYGLARSASIFGGCDCDAKGVVQLDRLTFTSLDEELLLQMELDKRQRSQERDRWIGRAVGAGVGLCFGLGDGFALGDLTGAFVAGAIGGQVASGLDQLSDSELEGLGLSWMRQPESFLFHQRRHGRAMHRVLLLACTTSGGVVSSCGVRFADGYLAFFAPEPYAKGFSPFDGTRKLSGKGAMPEPGQSERLISQLPCSDGLRRPLLSLATDQGPLYAMPLATPHHSLY